MNTRSMAPSRSQALLGAYRSEAAALIGEGESEADPVFRLHHLMALQKEPAVGLATGGLRQTIAGIPV